MTRLHSLRIALATQAVLALAVTITADAATRTWDGGVADDNLWTTAANWQGDIAPVAGDDLVFAGTNDVSTSNDFTAATIFNSITFSAGADPFTLATNGITLGTPTTGVPASGNITNSSSNLQAITLGINLGAGNHTIAGGASGIALNVAGGTVKSVGGGGTAIFSGTVNSTTIGNFSTSGILGGYATVGTNWATHNGTGIVAYSAYTSVAAGAAIADGTNTNVKITSAGTANTLGSATTNINTLITDLNTTQTINMGAGETLRLGRFGGIFRTGTTNSNTFIVGNTAGTGSLTAGGDTAGVTGEIVMNGGGGTGTGTQVEVRANVVDNGGGGTVTVIKTGRGYFSLTGTANSYTGGTFINEGRLQATQSGGLGTGDVTIQSGAEALLGNQTWANNFKIAGVGPQNENGNGAIRGSGTIAGTVTMFGDSGLGGGGNYTGQITGNFNLQFGATGNVGGSGSSITLTNPNANNTAGGNNWTGNTTIVARTGGTAGNTVVRLGASQQIPNGATAGNFIMGVSGVTTSTATFDLNGFNETINGLSVGSGATASLMTMTSGVAGSTLTLGDNNATATYAGNISGGANLALTKIGSGGQTLSGTNTYTGATTVNGGELIIASSLPAGTTTTINSTGTLVANGTVNGPVVVNSGGTLKGAGTVSGTVTVNNGGALAGGGSFLTLSGATVTFGTAGTDTSSINFTPVTPQSILVSAANALTINSNANTIAANIVGPVSPSTTYVLLDYNGTVGGTGDSGTGAFTLGSLPPRVSATLVNNVGNTSIDLNVTTVDSARWSGAKTRAQANEWSTNAIGVPKNWVLNSDGTTQTDYIQGDTVRFDDTATTTTPDISVADVSPSAVTFDHTTKDYTLTGSMGIAGTTGLTKTGGGKLTIGTPNSYSGTTAINNGTVSISASNNLGNASASNTISIAGGTLQSTGASVDLTANRTVAVGTGGATIDVTGSNLLTVSGTVSGAAANSLTKTGTGTLALNGTNTYAGVTNVNGGTARVNNSASLGAVASVADVNVATGAAVDLSGSTTANGINFGSKIFKIAGSGVGGTGALTNSGQITQNAAFNFITLTDDATIGGYRMDIGRAGVNGILDLQGNKLTLAMTQNAVATPQPLFSILTPSNATTTKVMGNGTIEVASGSLSFEVTAKAAAADVTSITFKSGANLQTFRLIAGQVTAPMIFEGNNTIGGGTTTGTVGQYDSPITLKGNVNLQGMTSGFVPTTPTNAPIILAGNIGETGGSFGLSAIGNNTTTLAGTNSYSGTTTINAGASIQIGGIQGDAATQLAAGPSGTLGTGNVVDNGALVFNRDNSSVYTANNAISGTGTVTKLGAGTLVLGGTNTYTGTTTVSTGTLLVNGTHTAATGGAYSVAAGATLGGTGTITSSTALTFTGASTLSPGASVGTLTLSAPVVLNSASKLVMELNGTNTTPGGTTNDLVAGVTNLTLDGTLDIIDAAPNSFASVANLSVWTLMTYTGALTNNGLLVGSTPTLPSGMVLAINLSQAGKVNLVAFFVPEANAFLAIGLVAMGTGVVGLMRRRRPERAANSVET